MWCEIGRGTLEGLDWKAWEGLVAGCGIRLRLTAVFSILYFILTKQIVLVSHAMRRIDRLFVCLLVSSFVSLFASLQYSTTMCRNTIQ